VNAEVETSEPPPTAAAGASYQPWEPSLWQTVLLSGKQKRFACTFFAQLDGEYEALCSEEYKAKTRVEVAALRHRHIKNPNWGLNHRLEYLLVDDLEPAILKQRVSLARSRLFALVGTEGAASYADAFPEPDSKLEPSELKAYALGVLVELQRLRHVQTEFERFRNRLIGAALLPGFGFVIIGLVSQFVIPKMSLAALAALLGLMGGFLSVLLRIGSLHWSVKYAANYQQVDKVFWNVLCSFYLSLAEGSIGAIILYIMFCTGLFKQVNLFPDFSSLPPGATLMRDVPHLRASQLMLWSVVAGFSERLVPDLLSSLSKQATFKPKPLAS
jgi:hypothetical protein